MATKNTTGANDVAGRGHYIVVGAGYGGLTAAIELTRRGISVEVIEAARSITTQGDVIQIGSSATRTISQWGKSLEIAQEQAACPAEMTLRNSQGKELLTFPLPTEFDGFPILFVNRGFAQKTFYEYALSLGIKFRFASRVTSYFEEGDRAGVYIGDERIEADGVIAADGIHSSARKYITGKQGLARTSGFALYRNWFSLDLLADDPRTKHLTELKKDILHVWIGKDTHTILLINVALRGVVVFCIHKDYYEIEESWTFPGDLNEMLEVVDGWDETLRAVISHIPPEVLIDWKLLWRDPLKNWVSNTGRVVLIGDASHPHLPTSASGGTMAFEDGVTIAVLIEKLGPKQIPLAFKVFETLRFERTALTQRMGWETRHRWHQTDWELVKKDPNSLRLPQPIWLYGHDPVQYANERFDEAVKSVQDGTPFLSINIPEGHVHEDWTVEDMLALESEQSADHMYKVKNR